MGNVMKAIVHKHYIDLYKTHMRFCFDVDTMSKACGEDVSDSDGYTWWPTQGDTIWIYLRKQDNGCIDVSSCAHECFHAADFIFERVGATISYGTGNEPMAYLIGYLVNKVFDALDVDNKLRT